MQQHAGTKVPLPKRRLHEGHADPFSLPEALAVRPPEPNALQMLSGAILGRVDRTMAERAVRGNRHWK
jgi:hypothetical protein